MALFDDIRRLPELDVFERRVFVRADFDLPLTAFGGILDDARLRAALPTLRHLIEARARVIVGAHYGSPAAPASHSSVRSVARRLGELLGTDVGVLGDQFQLELGLLAPGQVALTPNLAERREELSNDLPFAHAVARAIDVYVGDATAAAANEWASVVALPAAVPSRGAGFVLAADLDTLELVTRRAPVRPYTALVGGDSFRRKATLLWALSMRVDTLLLGGAVANTCLAARGVAVGQSVYEPDELDAARALLDAAEARGVSVHLPLDVLVRGAGGALERRSVDAVASDEAIVDVALDTCLAYRGVLGNSATVLWNGLLGTCDSDDTRSGTYRCAQVIAPSAQHHAVFGSRTVAMAELLALTESFHYVSRSGQGALALLGGTIFPGVESLRTAP